MANSLLVFVAGATASLLTSWVLVTRLERIGSRIGFSEALLGLVAALAADAPEITAAVTALAHHQQAVGAGVVIGSNVFNLAALLGLGAFVAGRIELHRKVVLLSGAIAMFVALVCLLAVARVLSPLVALVAVLVVVIPYVSLLAGRGRLFGAWIPARAATWLSSAVAEEEIELEVAIHPRRGRLPDVVMAVAALIIVVVASIAMEHGAVALGQRFGVADIVIGAFVLAAVTSLPNAVAAVYLARRGRGAATLSTALNSNAINVVAGLLVPATVIGIAAPTGPGLLVVISYVGVTAVTLLLAYAGRGLGRGSGLTIMGLYVAFVVVLLASA